MKKFFRLLFPIMSAFTDWLMYRKTLALEAGSTEERKTATRLNYLLLGAWLVLSMGGLSKRPAELEDAINQALGQANNSSAQDVYESMGVKAIWLNEWKDISALLDNIST